MSDIEEEIEEVEREELMSRKDRKNKEMNFSFTSNNPEN